jgi:hypothetical protein
MPKEIVILNKEYCGFESCSDIERDISEMFDGVKGIPAEFQGKVVLKVVYLGEEE